MFSNSRDRIGGFLLTSSLCFGIVEYNRMEVAFHSIAQAFFNILVVFLGPIDFIQ